MPVLLISGTKQLEGLSCDAVSFTDKDYVVLRKITVKYAC